MSKQNAFANLSHVLVLTFSLAAVLAMAPASAAPADAAATPCRVKGFNQEVLCGSVRRPLDPARPQGVAIDVHYVVVPALGRRKQPDPVFLFAGGPGQSAISVIARTMGLFSRLNNRRDIVFIDQRGTGKSAPLMCDDGLDANFDEMVDFEKVFERVESCRVALQKLPYGDLRFFSTTVAMQDIDAVRAQLGAAQINAVGASYGTRAVLEYMRQFPDHVRRAVIDGVAPPDMALPLSFSGDNQRALDAVIDACGAEPACSRRYPRLRQDWQGLLASLPRKVRAADPLSGEPLDMTLTRDHVISAVRGPLYGPVYAAALPAAIHAAAQGNFEAMVGLASIGASRSKAFRQGALALGMHLSVVCSEDMPLLGDAKIAAANPLGADFGEQQQRFYQRVCAGWPQAAIPAAFYAIPPSKAPVLLLSGGDDPVTPPRHGERVQKALGAKALHVVAPHAGHGVMFLACGPNLLTRFISDPEAQTAATLEREIKCLADMPRPTAFLPITNPSGSRP